MARDETMVRPERPGLKVAELMVDAGDTVTAGQTLARLTIPDGGLQVVQAPVSGTIAASTAVIGAPASGKGEALFTIIARNEFDLVGAGADAGHRPAQGRPAGPDQDHRRRRGRRRGAADRADGRAQQPARAGLHRHHRDAAALDQFLRPRADQDRAELRRRGAADRRALRPRRHRGPGGAARARRDASGSRSG